MCFEKQAMRWKENVYHGFLITTFLCITLEPLTGVIAPARHEERKQQYSISCYEKVLYP